MQSWLSRSFICNKVRFHAIYYNGLTEDKTWRVKLRQQ